MQKIFETGDLRCTFNQVITTADFLVGQAIAQVLVVRSGFLAFDRQNTGYRFVVAGDD